MDTVKILAGIVVINLLLSGDNALVIALASRNLPEKQQKKAILWGGLGAVMLRVVLTFLAVFLLAVPYIQLFGALFLLWVAIKLLRDDHQPTRSAAAVSLNGAIKMIIAADFVMSLDNVIAIAAVSHGNLLFLIIGLGLSIPIIMFGSQVVQRAMERWPIIVWLGAAFLGWTAGDMANDDTAMVQLLQNFSYIEDWLPVLFAVVVVAVGMISWKIGKRT